MDPTSRVRPARLGAALGADPQTFLGLAGVGDMAATCSSRLSRNHAFGLALGEGQTLEEVTAQASQTAEGVKSCRSIVELARSVDVDMPICDGVHAILYEGWGPRRWCAPSCRVRARANASDGRPGAPVVSGVGRGSLGGAVA